MASPGQSAQNDNLNGIFQGLKNKVADIRLQSALDLRRYVHTFALPFEVNELMELVRSRQL